MYTLDVSVATMSYATAASCFGKGETILAVGQLLFAICMTYICYQNAKGITDAAN